MAILKKLSASRSLLHGSILYVGYRWFDRFLGVISLAVLARLLSPEDFGIVAMATIVVGLLDAIFNMGVHVLVLQKDDPDERFLNSAWTLRFLQAALIAVCLAVSAPLAAEYFSEPKVEYVIYVLALSSLLGGLENFAIVIFQKSRQFFREFQLSAIKRLSQFVIVIALAYYLDSYWALVIGTLIARFLGVILAYAFYPVIHKLSLEHMRDLFGAGKWLLAMNILAYIWTRIDELIVGRYFKPAILGSYSIAAEVARMPTAELMAPISRALLPGFTSMKNDVEESRKLVLTSINIQASLALPAAAGLFICAEPIVILFLGEQWSLAADLLAILPIAFAAAALRYTGEYYLIAHEKQKLLTFVDLYYVLAFLGLVFWHVSGVDDVSLEFIVFARAVVEATGIGIMWIATSVVSKSVSVWAQINQMLRPLLATAAMIAALLSWRWDTGSMVADLGLTVALGGAVYVVSIALLWLVWGKPEGSERWIFSQVEDRFFNRGTGDTSAAD